MGKQQAESRQRAQHGGISFVESHDGNRTGLLLRERNPPPHASQSMFPAFQECNIGCDAPIRRAGIT
jgi:hypothetical protein